MQTRSAIAALFFTGAAFCGADAARSADLLDPVHFTCDQGKTIAAIFYADAVDLKLSDGRALTLPQVMSGSGIRYANADESLVFWSKGNTAFVTEGAEGKETFSGCVVVKEVTGSGPTGRLSPAPPTVSRSAIPKAGRSTRTTATRPGVPATRSPASPSRFRSR